MFIWTKLKMYRQLTETQNEYIQSLKAQLSVSDASLSHERFKNMRLEQANKELKDHIEGSNNSKTISMNELFDRLYQNFHCEPENSQRLINLIKYIRFNTSPNCDLRQAKEVAESVKYGNRGQFIDLMENLNDSFIRCDWVGENRMDDWREK